MPLPFKLDDVNLYLIEDHDGWFRIDAGIHHRSSTYAVWQRIVADGLARLALLPQDTLVLPAHNHPFYGPQSRVRALIDGHLAMLEQIVPMLDQPLTVKQLARQFRRRARGSVSR